MRGGDDDPIDLPVDGVFDDIDLTGNVGL